LAHHGPGEREGWAWDLSGTEGRVHVDSIVGLTDDGPIQWQIHTYGHLSFLHRFSYAAAAEREQVLTRWCEAIDVALKGDGRFRTIRWYDPETFAVDHGDTWADSPR
jgi:hypothetical protein